MLLSLHVVNLALIREEEISFGKGLNILTGETGAGKSILIGSLGLALGERLAHVMLRGDGDALVELVFSVDSEDTRDELSRLGIDAADDTIIITRRISRDGRSTCRINSETVTLSVLRRVSEVLVSVHGQRENGALLSAKNHLAYLDLFAKDEISGVLGMLKKKYAEYKDEKKLLAEAGDDDALLQRELSLLKYETEEIERAALVPGEDESLESSFRKMNNAGKIAASLSECRELTRDGTVNAADCVDRALRAVSAAAEYSDSAGELSDKLSNIAEIISDFNRELSENIDGLDFSEQELSEVTARLDLINTLKSKYGGSIEQIQRSREEKLERIGVIENIDEYRAGLKNKISELEAQLTAVCAEVSEIRKKYAQKLSGNIEESLRELNFRSVKFEISVEQTETISETGRDSVRFLIATNPGQSLMPLEDIASGGELSRIMLAMRSAFADAGGEGTLVFDEIDSGISGRTAQCVAEKMKEIAAARQVICITHLPQIAAMADRHFLIEKQENDTQAATSIRELSYDDSVAELARMLGGKTITDAALCNARELKQMAGTREDFA